MARWKGRGREAQPQGRIELRPQQQQQQTEQNILFRLSIDDSTKQHLIILFFIFRMLTQTILLWDQMRETSDQLGLWKWSITSEMVVGWLEVMSLGHSNRTPTKSWGSMGLTGLKQSGFSGLQMTPEMRNWEISKFQQSCSRQWNMRMNWLSLIVSFYLNISDLNDVTHFSVAVTFYDRITYMLKAEHAMKGRGQFQLSQM